MALSSACAPFGGAHSTMTWGQGEGETIEFYCVQSENKGDYFIIIKGELATERRGGGANNSKNLQLGGPWWMVLSKQVK